MIEADLVSIIMSVYNEDLKWISESVESILNQTYKNIEFVIVLDNPENIELRNLLEKYKKSDNRIKLLINEENKGLVESLNFALNYTNGKYIARMDADDISLLNRIEKQKEYLETNNLDFVFSGVQVIDEYSRKTYESQNKELSYKTVKKLLEITNCTYHPTWFVKSDIYVSNGGYRDISFCEDYDFTLRSINKGYKIGKMNYNVLAYRIRSNSISRSFSLEQFLNMRGILKLYKKSQLEDTHKIKQMLKESKKRSSEYESEKFIMADIEMNQAIGLIKQKEFIRGLITFLKTLSKSKYYINKNFNYIQYYIYKILLS